MSDHQPPSTTFMAEEQQQMDVDSKDHFDGGAVAQGGHVVGDSEPILAIPISMIPPDNSGRVPRKRGRPRKYGPFTTTTPTSAVVTTDFAPAGTFTTPHAPGSSAAPTAPTLAAAPPARARRAAGGSASASRGKGKGKGKGKSKVMPVTHDNKQQLVLGDSSWTHHIIIVKPGECLTSRIMAISHELKRNVSMVSAIGMISQVSLLDTTTGKYIKHEGQFQILSINGSLVLYGKDIPERSGDLNVTLQTDGKILKGLLTRELIASTCVQIAFQSYPGEYLEEPILTSLTGNVSAPGQSSS